MARSNGYGALNASLEHVKDAPRASLVNPRKWRTDLLAFARAKDIEQPLHLVDKTGATGSSPLFLLALGCMLGVAFANTEASGSAGRLHEHEHAWHDHSGSSSSDDDSSDDFQFSRSGLTPSTVYAGRKKKKKKKRRRAMRRSDLADGSGARSGCGDNVYSSASRAYKTDEFDKPPDTVTYICSRAGVASIDQARFKNRAKMESAGASFHKENGMLADAMRVAIDEIRPIINHLASKGIDYTDCNDAR